MLSCDKRLPLDTWNTSGLQGNAFGNQFSTFDSPRDYSRRIQSDDVQRNREAAPEAERTKTGHTSEAQTKSRHNSNADICNKAVDYEFYNTGGISSEFHGWTAKDSKFRSCNSTNSVIHNHFQCEKFDSKIKRLPVLIFHRMLFCGSRKWRLVDSLDELKSSRSVCGKDFPNFEMLDAKIASALNKIIQNSQFKKKVSLEEQKAQKEDRFLRGRQIAFMSYDYFRVTGAHDTALDYVDLLYVTLSDDNIQEFDTRWDEILLSMSKILSDDVLESLYKLRIRESAQLKTLLELYDMEIHHKISVSNYQKLITMVKRCIDQKLRLRNFDARHGRIETGAVVKNRKGMSGVERGKRYLLQCEKKKASVRKETMAVSGMGVTTVPKNQNTLPPHLPSHPSHEVEVRRRKEVSKTKASMVPFSVNNADII